MQWSKELGAQGIREASPIIKYTSKIRIASFQGIGINFAWSLSWDLTWSCQSREQ